jgi:hypothetical protein
MEGGEQDKKIYNNIMVVLLRISSGYARRNIYDRRRGINHPPSPSTYPFQLHPASAYATEYQSALQSRAGGC